ncbi:MAG TPA: pepsin-like aspartic protease [Kofleriaceae bacterium]|nr:pepsin-like aspartic protease [Kofleriaceae bacterium]
MLARISRTLVLAVTVGTLGCGNNSDHETPDAAVQVDAAPDAPASQAGVVAIPLIGLGGGYTAKLELGGQPFDVIVDTGSTSTGVAAATCTNCNVHPAYAPGAAMDLHQAASSQYGSGSWKGEVFEDAATMGGRPAVALDFASITSQTGFFQGPGFQGILGLGPDGLLLPYTTSYLTKLIAAGMTGEVAFQLCPDNGTMWLGGFDAAAATAAPSFTPLSSAAPYYIVNVGAASVAGTASLTGADFGPTIVDTGTTLTYVPTAVVTAVVNGIKGSTGYTSAFGTQTLADGACLTTTMTSTQLDAALPPLSLSFAGATTPISIPATRSYLFDQGGGQYCFTFSDSSHLFGSAQKVSLFGNTLLAGMLTVIDVDHKQIGFALQAGCAEASFAHHPMVVRRPSIDPATVAAIAQLPQP